MKKYGLYIVILLVLLVSFRDFLGPVVMAVLGLILGFTILVVYGRLFAERKFWRGGYGMRKMQYRGTKAQIMSACMLIPGLWIIFMAMEILLPNIRNIMGVNILVKGLGIASLASVLTIVIIDLASRWRWGKI